MHRPAQIAPGQGYENKILADISHMDLLVTITGDLSSIIGTTADVIKVGFAITTPL